MKKIILALTALCVSFTVNAKEFSLFGVMLGQDSVEVVLQAPFLSCNQLNCTFTAMDTSSSNDNQPRLGRYLLAGMQVHLINNRVNYVAITQHSENFYNVKAALISKYGKPNLSKKYDIDRGAGKFDNEMAYWENNGIRLALNKRTSYMDMLTVTISYLKNVKKPSSLPSNVTPDNLSDLKDKL